MNEEEQIQEFDEGDKGEPEPEPAFASAEDLAKGREAAEESLRRSQGEPEDPDEEEDGEPKWRAEFEAAEERLGHKGSDNFLTPPDAE